MQTMEDLRLALMVWSTVGILICLWALAQYQHYKRKNPAFGTRRASPEEAEKERKFIVRFLGGFMLYIILSACALAYVTSRTIPWVLLILVVLAAIFIFLPPRRPPQK